jgi:hypothetical protein
MSIQIVLNIVPLVIIKHYSSSVELQLKNVVDILKDETVDTASLSGILKTNSLLTDIDVQDIDTECINRHCEKAALLVLIDRVVTFHPDLWYQKFLEWTRSYGHKTEDVLKETTNENNVSNKYFVLIGQLWCMSTRRV